MSEHLDDDFDVGAATSAWLDETASEDAMRRLGDACRDEDAASDFVDQILLHALLEEHGSGREGLGDFVDFVAEGSSFASVVVPKTSSRREGRSRLRFPLTWLGAAAMAIFLIALVWQQQPSAAVAGPVDVIQVALHTHAQDVERVYIVEKNRTDFARDWGGTESEVFVTAGRDQFWVKVQRGDNEWAWGREDDGTVWLVLGPNAAMRLAPTEIGNVVQEFSDLYSLNLESLLNEVLQNCELEFSDSDALTHVVKARGKSEARQRPTLLEATIEVDRETKAIRRMSLTRFAKHGSRTVSFSLVETRTLDPSNFAPEGHILDGARVFAGQRTLELRRRVLVRRFGDKARNWIIDRGQDEV